MVHLREKIEVSKDTCATEKEQSAVSMRASVERCWPPAGVRASEDSAVCFLAIDVASSIFLIVSNVPI